MLLENIRELCAAYTISITNLEKVLGFGNGTITKWAKVSPSIDKLQKVANFFEVSVSYLLGEDNKKDSDDDELSEYLNMLRNRPECRMFLDTAKGATKEEVEQNVKFIEALRKMNDD